MATNKAECIVKEVNSLEFGKKETLEVDTQRIAVYNKANTTMNSNIKGYDNTAGTGTERSVLVDANGKLVVSATTTAGDLSARTDIADASSSTFVKCDSNGKLEVNGTVNVISGFATETTLSTVALDATLTDGTQKSVVMGDDSGTKRDLQVDSNGKLNVNSVVSNLPASTGQKANSASLSICRSNTAGAFDLSARTTIGTAGTSTKLLCDVLGQLMVNVGTTKEKDSITDDKDGTALIGSLGAGIYSESIDMSNFRSVSVLIDSSSTDGLELWACDTTNGTFVFFDEMFSGGMNGGINFTVKECPPKFLRIYNANAGVYTFTSIEAFKMD